jgi:uncharacterized protein
MLAAAENEEADAGPRTVAPGMGRRCIVTRAVKPTDELIRFVVGPDGAVVPDLKRKLPGRGVWVTGTRAALTTAAERKVFGRSFKREVRVPPDFADLVERLLERAALDALAIAHKGGRVALGFAKVGAALASDPVVALLHACDASADGARKLAGAAARRYPDAASRPVAVGLFTSLQLDLALGRSNVVHAAVLAGPASAGFLVRCRSLERFRSENGSVRGDVPHGRGAPASGENS